ncbi:uncharacterized protein M421DRAFT_415333 [Didymella exigua CBS 183.55]|uniref:Uncharacterized protein n=1 Tax=Didymella exigua CBS 183.55 TaxID=1150837 RepID=A0A6A5S0R1_9PLEO|nr:uncharacterized protein M421DRAFT_415333 [Didymella exigua CBS 183.55]KAF1934295.1 hypothetical protein M421DRAFT_415333 [Didymella exigua CBS 183.55]
MSENTILPHSGYSSCKRSLDVQRKQTRIPDRSGTPLVTKLGRVRLMQAKLVNAISVPTPSGCASRRTTSRQHLAC